MGLEVAPELFIVRLKIFGERVVCAILGVKCVAVGDYLPDVQVELREIVVGRTLNLAVDCFQIHWFFYDLEIIWNCLGHWVYWHPERPR